MYNASDGHFRLQLLCREDDKSESTSVPFINNTKINKMLCTLGIDPEALDNQSYTGPLSQVNFFQYHYKKLYLPTIR